MGWYTVVDATERCVGVFTRQHQSRESGGLAGGCGIENGEISLGVGEIVVSQHPNCINRYQLVLHNRKVDFAVFGCFQKIHFFGVLLRKNQRSVVAVAAVLKHLVAAC